MIKRFFFFILASGLFFWLCFPMTLERIMVCERPNIWLITMDTTAYNHLSSYGYTQAKTPNIDRLAADGVLFENSFTPVSLTQPTHSTLFTGTHPLYHGVRYNLLFRLPDEYKTLAEILKENQYQTAAFVGSYILEKRFNLNQGFDTYDDDFDPEASKKSAASNLNELFKSKPSSPIIERSAQKVVDLSLSWLNSSASSQKPFFLWTHFFDPHSPYRPMFQQTEKAGNPYDQEIVSVDEQIGRLYEALQKQDRLKETLIVFMTDHGEGLGLKGEKEHGFFLYDQTLHTALIYRYPKRFPPRRVPEMVTHLDFLPTLLDFLQISAPEEVQGESYLNALRGRPIPSRELLCEATLPKFTHGWALIDGLRNEDWKYIQAPKEELYHLKTDPYEVKNLVDQSAYRERLESMRVRYKELKQHLENRNATLEQVAIDSEHRDKMLSLGYVWGASSENTPEREQKDPKEMIEVYKLIAWSGYLLQKTNTPEMAMTLINSLEAILLLDPKNLWSLQQLARQFTRLGLYSDAERKYQMILELNKNQSEIHAELANIFMLQINYPEAEREIQKFLKMKQDQSLEKKALPQKQNEQTSRVQELSQGFLLQAEIYYRQNKFWEAQEAYEQFLLLETGHPSLRENVKKRVSELSKKK